LCKGRHKAAVRDKVTFPQKAVTLDPGGGQGKFPGRPAAQPVTVKVIRIVIDDPFTRRDNAPIESKVIMDFHNAPIFLEYDVICDNIKIPQV
jgi:hypothetical protein